MAAFGLLQGLQLARCGEDATGTPNIPADEALTGPPCQRFTPVLKDWYEEVADEAPDAIEIVFVSSDDSEQQWVEYMRHHAGYLAASYSSDVRAKLKKHFGICAAKEMQSVGVSEAERKSGIPGLAIIKQDGTLVTLEGVDDVERKGPPVASVWAKS